jgi:hypothetical protein
MANTKQYQLYAVKCGSTLFNQIGDATLSRNVQELVETPVGGILPLFTGEVGQRPDLQLPTHQLKTLFTLFGLLGGDAGITKLFGRKISNKTGQGAIASTIHSSWTSAASMGYITSVSASNRGRATANARIVFLYDGTNATIVYSGSAALDSFSSATQQYILGPIVLGGSILDSTNDLTINFNPQVLEPEDDYQYDPTFCAVTKIEPTVEFSTADPSIWSSNGAETTNLKISLIAVKKDGQREPDADSKHIVFASTLGQVRCQSIAGAKQMTRVFVRLLSSDNSVSPITVTSDTAVATS